MRVGHGGRKIKSAVANKGSDGFAVDREYIFGDLQALRGSVRRPVFMPARRKRVHSGNGAHAGYLAAQGTRVEGRLLHLEAPAVASEPACAQSVCARLYRRGRPKTSDVPRPNSEPAGSAGRTSSAAERGRGASSFRAGKASFAYHCSLSLERGAAERDA